MNRIYEATWDETSQDYESNVNLRTPGGGYPPPSGFSQIAKKQGAQRRQRGATGIRRPPLPPAGGRGSDRPPAVALRKYPDGAGLKEITNHGDIN